MKANEKISLPDGTFVPRLYDRALVMEKGYQDRYNNLMITNTLAGLVLTCIHQQMNVDGEFITDLNTIAKKIGHSRNTVTIAVQSLKNEFADLVAVEKFHGITKFIVDTTKCFKA